MVISAVQSEFQFVMQKVLFLCLGLGVISCNPNYNVTPIKQGVWRGELKISETEMLPFNFEIIGKKDVDDLLRRFYELMNFTQIFRAT